MILNKLKKIISLEENNTPLQYLIQDIEGFVSIFDNNQKLILGDLKNLKSPEIIQFNDALIHTAIIHQGQNIGTIQSSQRLHPALPLFISQCLIHDSQIRALGAETLEKYREINFLYDFTAKLSLCKDVESVAQLVINEAMTLIPSNCASIMFYEPESKTLEVKYGFGQCNEQKMSFPEGKGIAGSVFTQGIPEIINDTSLDERYIGIIDKGSSLLCVPLQTKKQTLGVMNVRHCEATFYSAQDLKSLIVLATQAAMAFEKAFLYADLQNSLLESEKMRQKAEQALYVRERFLANMSHEIRTPMNGIIGMSEILLANPLDQDSMELARIIKGSAENLLHLLNDILHLSKMESGQLEIHPVKMDLYHLIKDSIALANNAPKAQGIKIHLLWENSNTHWKIGDPNRIKQIINNLLSNAVKFCGQQDIQIVIENSNAHGLLQIKVIDHGIGIPSERIEAIFDPFIQVDQSTTRQFEGTGLGLTISRQLARMMDGDLWVQSKLNQGSTFILELPLAPCESETTPTENTDTATESQSSTPPNSIHCLVVDDNQINIMVICRILKKMKISYDIAINGQEAVDMVQKKFYPIVFMDCMMPVLDGYEATQKIRQSDFEQPWIIALTANAMEGDREKCINAGMNDYLSKPIKMDTIAQSIRRWQTVV